MATTRIRQDKLEEIIDHLGKLISQQRDLADTLQPAFQAEAAEQDALRASLETIRSHYKDIAAFRTVFFEAVHLRIDVKC